MLRDIIDAWRSGGVMGKMFEQFLAMLDDAEWMFARSIDALFEERLAESAQKDLYDRDIRVNQTERRIRKELVMHLAMHPGGDIPGCLMLMSICKDAERLGDYSKNAFEVRILSRGPLKGEFVPRIRACYDEALACFGRTRKAFTDCDESLSREIMECETAFGKRTEGLIVEIAESAAETRQAVAMSMATRFAKRVFAHLGNVASSVVMPVHKLDYFDETWREER